VERFIRSKAFRIKYERKAEKLGKTLMSNWTVGKVWRFLSSDRSSKIKTAFFVGSAGSTC